MRIKVLLEIDKPLRRGFRLATGPTSSKWVGIKYERLADYCFYCGRLDHTERDCQVLNDDENIKEEVVYQYGPFLRGSPLKSPRTSDAYRAKEAKLLKNLKEKKGTRRPSYNEPGAIKLGPPGAAKKLLFETLDKTSKGESIFEGEQGGGELAVLGVSSILSITNHEKKSIHWCIRRKE
uniref:CCHC-type domain-containing protein n=1 Tax=Chenopodium quinoa TaxID=63459 RepID=A0A803N419_CHEQI